MTAIFEFTGKGFQKAILLNAPSDEGQRVIEKALNGLRAASYRGWIGELLRRFR
jgi:hypothetical protein